VVTKEPAQYIGDEAARAVPGRPVPSAARGNVEPGILVLALATAAHMASPERKGRVLSITIGGISVAWVVGVPLGAVIVDYFGWRTSFGVAAALAVVAAALLGLVFAARLPRRSDPRAPKVCPCPQL
jgi:predicted MFS family arabinose efflux permease